MQILEAMLKGIDHPIFGVTMGNPDDPDTWRLYFLPPGVTEQDHGGRLICDADPEAPPELKERANEVRRRIAELKAAFGP